MQIALSAIIKVPEFFGDSKTLGGSIVKVSSGWSKGLKILTPEGLDTRPTRERVRQAAINMLQPWITEARVLDLFAGSGSVGIELVSRGAMGARFVEKNPAALKCLRANAAEAELRAKRQDIALQPWSVESADVASFVKTLDQASFDLVWADPPYDLVASFLEGGASEIPRILSQGGVFVLESGAEALESLNGWSSQSNLELIKQREYGVTLITIWQKN